MKWEKCKMKKNKNIRATCLRDHVGETCIFLGKIKRTSYAMREMEDAGLIRTTLVNSLYVNLNDEWKYISHAWIELPDEIAECKEHVLLFAGEVYDYEHTNGLEDFSIKFKEMQRCEPWNAPYYHGIRMSAVECHDSEKHKRRQVNNNLSIINAYENGVDLDLKHNFKGKRKELERRKLKIENICKKEFFATAQYQLSPIPIQQVYEEEPETLKSSVIEEDEINTIEKLCEEFSILASSI